MKHDLSAAKDLLESCKYFIEIKNILDWIYFYEMKLRDSNQKKSSPSMNQRQDLAKSLKECIEMKKMIIKMYDDFFLKRLNFAYWFQS